MLPFTRHPMIPARAPDNINHTCSMVMDTALVEPILAIEESLCVFHPFQLLNVCMHRRSVSVRIYTCIKWFIWLCMLVWVHMYVCNCKRLCTCMCECVRALHTHMHAGTDAHTHICIRVRTHANIFQHCFELPDTRVILRASAFLVCTLAPARA